MTAASDGPGDLHVATVVIDVQYMRRAVVLRDPDGNEFSGIDHLEL